MAFLYTPPNQNAALQFPGHDKKTDSQKYDFNDSGLSVCAGLHWFLCTATTQTVHSWFRAVLKNIPLFSCLGLRIAWLYLLIYDAPPTQKRHSWKHVKCKYFEVLRPGAQDALVNLYTTPKQKPYFGFRGLCGNSECLIWGRLWIHSLFGRLP